MVIAVIRITINRKTAITVGHIRPPYDFFKCILGLTENLHVPEATSPRMLSGPLAMTRNGGNPDKKSDLHYNFC